MQQTKHEGGWPIWKVWSTWEISRWQRFREAWWALTGKWTLHKAWQAGHNQGARAEYYRVVINQGDLVPYVRVATAARLYLALRQRDKSPQRKELSNALVECQQWRASLNHFREGAR
jgi:hypothetical protein